ncbi:hypothetical protein DL95DRAFT_379747, partial [Leptodontidium sp. 2 PMI_412]
MFLNKRYGRLDMCLSADTSLLYLVSVSCLVFSSHPTLDCQLFIQLGNYGWPPISVGMMAFHRIGRTRAHPLLAGLRYCRCSFLLRPLLSTRPPGWVVSHPWDTQKACEERDPIHCPSRPEQKPETRSSKSDGRSRNKTQAKAGRTLWVGADSIHM